MSDALSSEWQKYNNYVVGDRVAFKLGNVPGVAAFECIQPHYSTYANQVEMSSGNIIHGAFPGSAPTTIIYSPSNIDIRLDLLYNVNLSRASAVYYS